MTPILLVSINGACTRIEKYPGEIFDQKNFQFLGLSTNEFQQHRKDWQNYAHRICVLNFSFGKHDKLDLSKFDTVLVFNEETINDDPKKYRQTVCETFCNNNVFIITSGYDLNFKLPGEYFYLLPFFCLRVALYNQPQPQPLPTNKDKIFDALLGMQKAHRNTLFYNLARHDMLTKCLINYTTNQWHDSKLYTIYRSPELNYLDDDVMMSNGVFNSYAFLDNQGCMMSHTIPWKVYQRTHYSLVAETDYTSHCFVTEKTAKCLYAHRIFVLFAGWGMLDHCRKLGFRTFDEIFDESYDDIQDLTLRCKAAFEQVKWLTHQDPVDLYHKAAPVLQHNQRHIQNRDFFVQPLKKWILSLMSRNA